MSWNLAGVDGRVVLHAFVVSAEVLVTVNQVGSPRVPKSHDVITHNSGLGVDSYRVALGLARRHVWDLGGRKPLSWHRDDIALSAGMSWTPALPTQSRVSHSLSLARHGELCELGS